MASFASIAVLLALRVAKALGKKRFPAITLMPDLLLVVGINILLVYAFDLESHGLDTLGHVGSGFVVPSLPRIASVELSVADVMQTILVVCDVYFYAPYWSFFVYTNDDRTLSFPLTWTSHPRRPPPPRLA